jgi:hypothetical protein
MNIKRFTSKFKRLNPKTHEKYEYQNVRTWFRRFNPENDEPLKVQDEP